MPNQEMINIRNKKTGAVIQVPSSKFVNGKSSTKGWKGVAEDVGDSLSGVIPAGVEMINALPGQLKETGRQIIDDPMRAYANLGLGLGEGAVGTLNIPSNIAKYLSRKDIISDKAAEDVLRVPDLGFEKAIGMDQQQPGDALLRLPGQFALPGKFGNVFKGLGKVGKAGVAGATFGASQDQDPLQASILTMLGQIAGRGVSKAPQAVVDTAKAIPDVAKKVPEVAANIAASGLETGADALSQIPMVGKAIGKVAQPTMGALGSYLKHLSVTPEELAQRTLFGDIKPKDIPTMLERNAAFKRAGILYGTPAELSLRQLESAKQASIGRTSAGIDELGDRDQARTQSEIDSVGGLLDLIYNGEQLSPEKKAAYAETMTGEVPQSFIEKHSKKPTIKAAMREIESDPAYQELLEEEIGAPVGSVKPNQFVYWDLIKRALGDIEENKKETGKATTKSSVYGRTRRAMVKEMDAIKPEYKVARNLAEREKTRQKVEKYFDKRPLTVNNLNKYLESKRNYEELSGKVEGLPEAKQRLDDLHFIGGNLIPSKMNIRAQAALKKTGMTDARNQLDAAKRDLDERFGQEHDVAKVKLMTDPNFVEKLTEYLSKKGK